MQAVNWNERENYNNTFWNQNVSQMWVETEFNVSKDIKSWLSLSKEEQEVFKKVLAGLTALDTKQANQAMPLILLATENLKSKSVLSFMSMMEQVHAKSYSYIFTTLLPSHETDYLLNVWVNDNKFLNVKDEIIGSYYNRLYKRYNAMELYLAHVASVFLESFLFYSGFYYPLLLSGTGKMVTSGEIVRKIQQDESIHGSFVGLKAQELYETLSPAEKEFVDMETYVMLNRLMNNEILYTNSVYSVIGIADDVIEYLKYNANKALQLLGKDEHYIHESVNPVVINALDSKINTNVDFFTHKPSYILPTQDNVGLDDSDFSF